MRHFANCNYLIYFPVFGTNWVLTDYIAREGPKRSLLKWQFTGVHTLIKTKMQYFSTFLVWLVICITDSFCLFLFLFIQELLSTDTLSLDLWQQSFFNLLLLFVYWDVQSEELWNKLWLIEGLSWPINLQLAESQKFGFGVQYILYYIEFRALGI